MTGFVGREFVVRDAWACSDDGPEKFAVLDERRRPRTRIDFSSVFICVHRWLIEFVLVSPEPARFFHYFGGIGQESLFQRWG